MRGGEEGKGKNQGRGTKGKGGYPPNENPGYGHSVMRYSRSSKLVPIVNP